ncbi:hypothetical protein GGS20DRAFT_229088 [Poronia punctata]|nr:hypothetical protein GGS20DRAFT_229088 [Poronia punctata]
MEQPRFPRRSASHGTLRSSYSSPGLPCLQRPLHKPLRSVKENSVLLPSPGALESMLKTTTETGDIGIFSINPVPFPPRPRGASLDIVRSCQRPRRSVENLHRQAIRPQYTQDITSELLSAYGSESFKSGASTLFPNSIDDPGQRSNSMTTCGSRHLSHHRSTNTLQSQASSGSYLQRPRSPFPYPTRLKRPGVRPASPAVTENGMIDYSRMVEIDRISYRTVHGHFNHVYSPMFSRPNALGLRPDANRSSSSLAPPGPLPRFNGHSRPPSVRTHSPVSVVSWNPAFRDGPDSTSVRTSSLVSAAKGHPQVPPALQVGRGGANEPPPRYYDYTEDFENRPTRPSQLTREFKMSPRADSHVRPMMEPGDDGTPVKHRLAAVFGEDDSAFSDSESQFIDQQDTPPAFSAAFRLGETETCAINGSSSHCRSNGTPLRPSMVAVGNSDISYKHTGVSDIDLLPSQNGRDSIDTFNPNLDVESRCAPPSYSYVSYRANSTPKTETKSLERHVQVLGGRAPTIRSEQGVILRDDGQDGGTNGGSGESYISGVGSTEVESDSGPLRQESMIANDKRPTSLETSNESQPTPTRDKDRRDVTPPNYTGSQASLNSMEAGSADERGAEHTGASSNNSDSEMKDRVGFRRHKRNHAALRISTTNLPRDDNEGHPHIKPTCSTAPLISPKPISPARQLKVKNSIPQLMKTLPPLPGNLGYNLPPTTADVLDEDEFAEILVPFDFRHPTECSFSGRAAPFTEHTKGDSMTRSLQSDGPKFRLKMKTSNCSDSSGPSQSIHQALGQMQGSDLDKNAGSAGSGRPGDENLRNRNLKKLKVRSPRRSRLSSPQSSTVRHKPGIETSKVVADLVRQKPQDLFSASPQSDTVILRKGRSPFVHSKRPRALTSPNSSDFSISERVISSAYRVSSTLSSGEKEVFPAGRAKLIRAMPRRGLITRLSHLRTLLSSSSSSPPPPIGGRGSTKTSSLTNGSSINLDSHVMAQVPDAHDIHLGRRLRARLTRWVRGAEAVMRKRTGRKRHSYGQRLTEETHL